MAKIDVFTADISGLSSQLKRAADTIADMENVLSSAQSNLNMEVAARSNIQTQISAARTSLKKQNASVAKLASLSALAAEDFASADRLSGKKASSAIGKVNASVTTVNKALKYLLNIRTMSKVAGISAAFLGTSALLSKTSRLDRLKAVLERVAASVKEIIKIITTPKSTTEGSTATGATTGVPAGETTGTINTTTNANLVAFDNNIYKSICKDKNGYSNYTILKGMKKEYAYCQGNYSKNFAKRGCLSTADAIAQSIKDQKTYDPTSTFSESQGLTTSCRTKKIEGSADYTEAQMLSETYKQLQQGNPVVLRVETNTGSSGHSVTAIGIRNGADPNNLTDADILIADPANGKIMTLAERYRKNGSSALNQGSGYPMRIPR